MTSATVGRGGKGTGAPTSGVGPGTAGPASAVGARGAGSGMGVAASRGVPRGRRRSSTQVLLAVLLIVGCAAVGAALFVTGSARTTVVVAARDIPVGAQIEAGDLAAAEIDGAGVSAVAGSDAGQLLGQTATTTIPAGTLLNAEMVADAPPPGPGRVAVGLALPTGRLPVELAAGRQVQVVLVPAAQEVTVDPQGRVLVEQAEVLSVAPDASGAFLVTIAIEESESATITSAAAVNRLTLAMLPVEAAEAGQ